MHNLSFLSLQDAFHASCKAHLSVSYPIAQMTKQRRFLPKSGLVSFPLGPVKYDYEGERDPLVYRRMSSHYIAQTLQERKVSKMLKWSIIFLIIAIVAGIFGFFGIVSAAATIAKVLFFIFLVLFIISLFTGRSRTP